MMKKMKLSIFHMPVLIPLAAICSYYIQTLEVVQEIFEAPIASIDYVVLLIIGMGLLTFVYWDRVKKYLIENPIIAFITLIVCWLFYSWTGNHGIPDNVVSYFDQL